MEQNKDIKTEIDSTLNAMDAIEKVNVSSFFKDKTMQLLFIKEEELTVWRWFTPKLQLATLLCMVVLNVFAFSKLNTTNASSYDENIDQFADTYGLSTSINISFLN